MMMMMVTETESNGQKPVLHEHHHQGSDEKGRRHPRWTREETLFLIQAKEITENTPHKGRKMTSASAGAGSENTEPKWVMISAQCKQQGVNRGPAQCRKRWSNLIGDYKKVKAWEDKLTEKSESFWVMRNDMRKERRLPVSFDREVFRVLEGRENGPPGLAVFPLPLQAVAAALVSDDGDDGEEEEEEAEEEPEPESGPEPEPECEPKEMVNDGHGVEIEDLLVSEFRREELGEEATVLGWKSEEKQTATNNVTNNVTDSPVKEFRSPEPISEQHHQAFQNQKTQPSQATGAFRESWPGISYWNSQERGKRPRLSTDGNQGNDKEDKIIRALKTNNKMLHDQLDVHNKNCQLDREQRKESNDALLAALGKLTDAIVKIAEKL